MYFDFMTFLTYKNVKSLHSALFYDIRALWPRLKINEKWPIFFFIFLSFFFSLNIWATWNLFWLKKLVQLYWFPHCLVTFPNVIHWMAKLSLPAAIWSTNVSYANPPRIFGSISDLSSIDLFGLILVRHAIRLPVLLV